MGYDNQKEIVKKTLWEQITDTLRENIIHGKNCTRRTYCRRRACAAI